MTEPAHDIRPATGQRKVAARGVLATVAVVLSLVPMMLVPHLPLVDYPNHLARFEIYGKLATSYWFQEFYQWRWAFIPNLAMDLLIIPATYVLPVEKAANLVSLLALLALCLGTIQLDRELHGGRWGLSAFVGLIIYNAAFRFGFINYIIGIAFALAGFVFWLRLRSRLSVSTLLGFTLFGAFLLLLHLYAFGLYAVSVAGAEFAILLEQARARADRRRPRLAPSIGVAASLVLPLGLMALSPTSTNAAITRWSSLTWKMEAVLSPIFFNQPLVELPLYLVLASLVGLGLLTGVLRVHRRMVWSILVFAILCLAMPRTLFGSNYADFRMLSGAAFFFLGSLEYVPRRPAAGRVATTVLSACLLVRIASVAIDWVRAQPILAEYDNVFDPVPPGAKVLVLQGMAPSASANRSPPLEHVPVFAAAKREAFVGYIFTGPAITLQLKPAYLSYEQFTPYPELSRDMARFDYLLAVGHPTFVVPEGLSLQRVGEGRTYTLSRIVHDR